MRKTLIAAGAAVFLGGPAMAADFYVPPIVPPPPAPVYYSWTGPYVGLQKGWSWANFSESNFLETYSDGAFVLGVYGGYNWSLGPNWIFGLETDFNWSNVLDNTTVPFHGVRENSFGSVRARLGYAMDRTLLYVAGGWAYSNVTMDFLNTSVSRTHNGWTIGVGVDHAFTQNLFGRIEYRYTAYGPQTYPLFPNHVLSYNDSKVLFSLALKY